MRLSIMLLGILLLGTVCGPRVQAQVSEQDSLALVALYNATNGPNWTTNTNWLTAPVSTWVGVTVAADRVTGVELRANGLNGTLPEDLEDLTNLQALDLGNNQPLMPGNNQLTGAIPPTLRALANLTILDLSFNQFTGAIPAELGMLTNLGRLDVRSNQLTGAIPAELGDLANLTVLNLNNNQLTGPIPPALGSLSLLRELDLAINQLTGAIPADLGNLGDLQSLILNTNPFAGAVPLRFINLTNLLTFNFSNTDLCEPVEAVFQQWLAGITNLTSTGVSCESISFTGGPGDGYASVSLSNRSLSGLTLFTGGGGDGYGSVSLSNRHLSGLTLFTGGAGDGYASALLGSAPFPSFVNVYVGGPGDGYASALLTGVALPAEVAGVIDIPGDFLLSAVYPNPFNPQATFTLAVKQTQRIEIALYDMLGRRVALLYDGPLAAYTMHLFELDGSQLPSGKYVVRVAGDGFIEARSVVLLK